MLKCIFILLKPRLNTSGCVHGRTVILKSCFIVRIQHLDCRLPKLSTQSLAVFRPFRVITGPAEYHDIAAQIITDPPPCFTVGTRHLGLQTSLGVRSDVGQNVKDNSSDHISYFQSSDVQVLSHSHHLFRRLALFSVIRSLAMAALPWMLDV